MANSLSVKPRLTINEYTWDDKPSNPQLGEVFSLKDINQLLKWDGANWIPVTNGLVPVGQYKDDDPYTNITMSFNNLPSNIIYYMLTGFYTDTYNATENDLGIILNDDTTPSYTHISLSDSDIGRVDGNTKFFVPDVEGLGSASFNLFIQKAGDDVQFHLTSATRFMERGNMFMGLKSLTSDISKITIDSMHNATGCFTLMAAFDQGNNYYNYHL